MIKPPILFNKHTIITLLTLLTLCACSSLPGNENRTPSYALTHTETSTLAKSIQAKREEDGIAASASGMILLTEGVDAFIARAAIARMAEQSLDVQYYLFHSDICGTLLTHELVMAADRGVRVRVLLDDMDTSGKDETLARINAHPNMEMRVFNPFIRGKSRTGQFVSRFGSVTRRMHNKAMIADNQIAIIGGRNIGDEYFGANPEVAFGDLDVTVSTPGAQKVSTAFDLYWNSELSYPVELLVDHQPTEQELEQALQELSEFVQEQEHSPYAEALRNSPIIETARKGKTPYHWGDVAILYDHPLKISSSRDKTKYHLTPQLGPYINNVKSELIVISPYFVPGKEGVAFFSDLQKKGVHVRILTNSLASNDVPIVHSGYAKYRKALLKAGIELYELDRSLFSIEDITKKRSKFSLGSSGSKASLHAKYFVMDRESAFIGSLNLDPRSVVENTEIGAVIESPDLANQLAQDFDTHIRQIAFKLKLVGNDLVWERKSAQETKIFYKEPHTSWWDRFTVGLMRLLPAESQL